MHYPSLKPQHLINARLYADRYDMLINLKPRLPENPVICEVGVAVGGFSQFMMETLNPAEFHAIDLFGLHNQDLLFGQPTSEIFGSGTHAEYYRDKFPAAVIVEGDSAPALNRYPAEKFDLIYIDGDHRYEGAKADMMAAFKAIKPDGIMIFNDYIMYDHIQKGDYGVVQVVNELVASSDWRIVGFGLEVQMFCDIALQREPEIRKLGTSFN